MSLFVFGSLHGSPGVTTSALLVAGCLSKGVVVEADPDGGVLAVRYGLGREPGLATLAAAGALEPVGWWDHAQSASRVPVLVGPEAPQSAAALWSHAGTSLARTLTSVDADVVVDAGRLRPGTVVEPLLALADLVVIVVRPRVEDLVILSHRLTDLRRRCRALGVVLIGPGKYRPGEVRAQLDVGVLGELPEDRGCLRRLNGDGLPLPPRALTRTVLGRAARTLAATLTAYVANAGSPMATAPWVHPPGHQLAGNGQEARS